MKHLKRQLLLAAAAAALCLTGLAAAKTWTFPEGVDPALRIADAGDYDFPDGFKATLRFSADLSKVNPKCHFANLFTKGRDFNDGYSVMIREDGHLLFYFLGVKWKMWPRGCALAEVFWSGDGKPGYDDFLRRMRVHRARLIAQGVNCAPLE